MFGLVGSEWGIYVLSSVGCFLQVGSYFVGQYYQVLQQQPDLVHQFYSEASSMTRVDGDSTETASTMLVIFPSYLQAVHFLTSFFNWLAKRLIIR